MKLGRAADALGVGGAKVLVSLGVLAAGFRAVSDDDYARIVIAQRFAAAPSLDPSGTSWLPLPFWVYGAAFRALGHGLGTARVVAVLLGVGAALVVFAAARVLGVGRLGTLTGALLAALFPWSAWLGSAPIPEAPAAALCVFGCATLTREAPRERLLGAFALAAACFCRYEAWPIALTFALFTLKDGARGRDARLLVAAGVALGAIGAWLLHGVFIHGDALFFWKRVAGYRQALGEAPPFFERLASVPRAFLFEAPELTLGAALLLPRANWLARYRRPALACLALALFLLLGELSGGGPTHHNGRAVLPLWYLLAIVLGDAVGRRVEARPERSWAWLGLASSLVALGWVYRLGAPPHFPDRSAAVELGERAAELRAPALLIDTPDYSFLAVTAAFGKPRAAEPFDDRDPRHPRAADAFVSETALAARWQKSPHAWLAVTSEHAPLAARLGTERARAGGLALFAPRETP